MGWGYFLARGMAWACLSTVSPLQRNPRAHKNKIGTPPPQNPNNPPPKTRNFMDRVCLQKERIFPGVHTIGAAISGPRIADMNFTDTRIFLTTSLSQKRADSQLARDPVKQTNPQWREEFI